MTRLPLSQAACWWLALSVAGWGVVALLLWHPRAALGLIAVALAVELLSELARRPRRVAR